MKRTRTSLEDFLRRISVILNGWMTFHKSLKSSIIKLYFPIYKVQFEVLWIMKPNQDCKKMRKNWNRNTSEPNGTSMCVQSSTNSNSLKKKLKKLMPCTQVKMGLMPLSPEEPNTCTVTLTTIMTVPVFDKDSSMKWTKKRHWRILESSLTNFSSMKELVELII
jgi:hypothetical protein